MKPSCTFFSFCLVVTCMHIATVIPRLSSFFSLRLWYTIFLHCRFTFLLKAAMIQDEKVKWYITYSEERGIVCWCAWEYSFFVLVVICRCCIICSCVSHNMCGCIVCVKLDNCYNDDDGCCCLACLGMTDFMRTLHESSVAMCMWSLSCSKLNILSISLGPCANTKNLIFSFTSKNIKS